MLWENSVSCKLLSLLRALQSETLFKDYILAGGTSLALQIGHRESEDIDLFTTTEQNNELLLEYFKNKYNFFDAPLNDKKNILQLIVNDIKIDLISVKGKMLEMPKVEDGIKMFGIHDIVGMKLLTIGDRKKAKDYIDIACLLRQMPLEKMFEIYRSKYDTDINSVKCNLLDVDKVNPYMWQNIKMLWNDFYVSDVPGIIKDEIKRYNKKHGIGKKNIIDIVKKLSRKISKKDIPE